MSVLLHDVRTDATGVWQEVKTHCTRSDLNIVSIQYMDIVVLIYFCLCQIDSHLLSCN